MAEVVLDASAVVAVINDEPGHEMAANHAPNLFISAVNLSEVAGWLVRRGMGSDAIDALVGDLQLRVVPFDQAQALAAAHLWPRTHSKGLSLGDRACLALAAHMGLPAYTTDRAWTELDLDIEIVAVR